MFLAGIPIPDDDVREFARLVAEPARGWLEKALARRTEIVALTIADGERILRALDDPRRRRSPSSGPLLLEHEGRMRDGLI